jgi:heptosyltransferase III
VPADGLNIVRLRDGYRFRSRRLIAFLKVIDALMGLAPRRRSPLSTAPRSILLMKPDHLGDLLLVTAILPLLAKRYPNAAIDLICGPWSEPIVANNLRLRRTIPLAHIAYNRGRRLFVRKLLDFLLDVGHILKIMHQERYELCLNLRDAGGDLNFLARLGGCRHIIGHATGGCGPLLDTIVPWAEGCHEVEHYLELLRPLGIEASLSDLHYELFPSLADEACVEQIVADNRLETFVLIHPGCGDKRKLRTSGFWVELIAGIDLASSVVVTGAAEEMPLFNDIAVESGRKLISLVGELSIAQLFLLMRKSSGVYALDSLAAHLGAASGVPTTVFWSDTNDPCQWRPLGANVELSFNSEMSGS